jgi:hypothetical protein
MIKYRLRKSNRELKDYIEYETNWDLVCEHRLVDSFGMDRCLINDIKETDDITKLLSTWVCHIERFCSYALSRSHYIAIRKRDKKWALLNYHNEHDGIRFIARLIIKDLIIDE